MESKNTLDLIIKTSVLLATLFIDVIIATVSTYEAFNFPMFVICAVLNILTGIIIGWEF